MQVSVKSADLFIVCTATNQPIARQACKVALYMLGEVALVWYEWWVLYLGDIVVVQSSWKLWP